MIGAMAFMFATGLQGIVLNFAARITIRRQVQWHINTITIINTNMRRK